MPKPQPPSLVTIAWLQKQFDEIDLQFAVVRNLINELKNQNILILAEVRKLGGTSGNISPELEKAILENSARSKGIDEKVPDQGKCQ
jgi:hypothetical protein